MVKKLLSYVGEYKKWILLAPVLMVVEVVCEIILPRLMAAIIDVGIKYSDMDAILKNGGLMLLLAAIGMAAGILSARMATKGGQGFGANLRNAMFQKIQDFSFADIDRFSSASLITRTTNDVNQIQMTLTMATHQRRAGPGAAHCHPGAPAGGGGRHEAEQQALWRHAGQD